MLLLSYFLTKKPELEVEGGGAEVRADRVGIFGDRCMGQVQKH